MTRLLIILLSGLIGMAETAGALEILTPSDGGIYHRSPISLVVTGGSADTIILFNGKKLPAVTSPTPSKSILHGHLQPAPGMNSLTVKTPKQSRSIHFRFAVYHGNMTPEQEQALFHRKVREKRCAPCHRITAAETGETQSACSPCHTGISRLPHPHSALEETGCSGCHTAEYGKNGARFQPGKREAALCGECHELPAANQSQPILHGPLGTGQCTVCHDPHGSAQPQLLIADQPDLCLNCHQDLKTAMHRKGAVIHPVIEDEGCTVCHGAHQGEYAFMLHQPVNALCARCHDESIYAHRKHPVDKHPVKDVADPLHPGKKLNCVSCHDPHAGSGEKLLRADSYLKLCRRCHNY